MHDASSLSLRAFPLRGARRKSILGLLGLVVTGVVLSACSSSSNSGSSATTATTSSPGGASSATTSGGPVSGSSSTASQLQALSSEVQSGAKTTYKAVYTIHNTSGTSEMLTLEQMPPKSVFSTSNGSVINDGTHTYFCTASGGTQQCVSETSTGTNPLASLTNLFDPTTLLNEFHAAQAAAAAHTAGYSVALSSGSYAGLSAKCLNYTGAGQTVKYCVTNSGILAYAMAAGGTFELTSLSSSPPASDFALPAGATVVTIPNISVPSTP